MIALLWFLWGAFAYVVSMFGVEYYKENWLAGVIGAGAVLIFSFWIVRRITEAISLTYYY